MANGTLDFALDEDVDELEDENLPDDDDGGDEYDDEDDDDDFFDDEDDDDDFDFGGDEELAAPETPAVDPTPALEVDPDAIAEFQAVLEPMGVYIPGSAFTTGDLTGIIAAFKTHLATKQLAESPPEPAAPPEELPPEDLEDDPLAPGNEANDEDDEDDEHEERAMPVTMSMIAKDPVLARMAAENEAARRATIARRIDDCFSNAQITAHVAKELQAEANTFQFSIGSDPDVSQRILEAKLELAEKLPKGSFFSDEDTAQLSQIEKKNRDEIFDVSKMNPGAPLSPEQVDAVIARNKLLS